MTLPVAPPCNSYITRIMAATPSSESRITAVITFVYLYKMQLWLFFIPLILVYQGQILAISHKGQPITQRKQIDPPWTYQTASPRNIAMHCKNRLLVLTAEWLPWLQTWGRDSSYERFIVLLETNCISILRSWARCSNNHHDLTILRTSVREYSLQLHAFQSCSNYDCTLPLMPADDSLTVSGQDLLDY